MASGTDEAAINERLRVGNNMLEIARHEAPELVDKLTDYVASWRMLLVHEPEPERDTSAEPTKRHKRPHGESVPQIFRIPPPAIPSEIHLAWAIIVAGSIARGTDITHFRQAKPWDKMLEYSIGQHEKFKSTRIDELLESMTGGRIHVHIREEYAAGSVDTERYLIDVFRRMRPLADGKPVCGCFQTSATHAMALVCNGEKTLACASPEEHTLFVSKSAAQMARAAAACAERVGRGITVLVIFTLK